MLARLSYELSLIESLISLWIYFFIGTTLCLALLLHPSSLNLLSSLHLLTCFLSRCYFGLTSLIYYIFMGNVCFSECFFLLFICVVKEVFWGYRCIKIYVIQVKWGQSFFLHHISGDLVMEFKENPEMSLCTANLGSVFCLVYKTVLSFSISN